LTDWIDEKVALQAKLSLYEAPAFKAKELATKLSQLGHALKALNKIPKPKKIETKTEDSDKEDSSKYSSKSKVSEEEPEETVSFDDPVPVPEDKPKTEL